MDPPLSAIHTIDHYTPGPYTFAGAVFNAAMANALGDLAHKVSSDNLAISLGKVFDKTQLKNRIRQLLAAENDEVVRVPLDAEFIQELKFSECIPQKLLDAELRGRYCCEKQFRVIRKSSLGLLNIV